MLFLRSTSCLLASHPRIKRSNPMSTPLLPGDAPLALAPLPSRHASRHTSIFQLQTADDFPLAREESKEVLGPYSRVYEPTGT